MYVHTKYTSTYSSIPGTYSSIRDIYVSVLVLQCTTNTSDGWRAVFVHRNTAYVPGAALLLLLSALYIDFLSLPISVGIAGAPPLAVSAPDLAVGA